MQFFHILNLRINKIFYAISKLEKVSTCALFRRKNYFERNFNAQASNAWQSRLGTKPLMQLERKNGGYRTFKFEKPRTISLFFEVIFDLKYYIFVPYYFQKSVFLMHFKTFPHFDRFYFDRMISSTLVLESQSYERVIFNLFKFEKNYHYIKVTGCL